MAARTRTKIYAEGLEVRTTRKREVVEGHEHPRYERTRHLAYSIFYY